jgi:hypothetical protein
MPVAPPLVVVNNQNPSTQTRFHLFSGKPRLIVGKRTGTLGKKTEKTGTLK